MVVDFRGSARYALIGQIQATEKTKTALEAWSPSILTPSDQEWDGDLLVKAARSFLADWKERKYGRLTSTLQVKNEKRIVDLAVGGGVFGEVGAPQPVRGVGDEPALHQVLVRRRQRGRPGGVCGGDRPRPARRRASAGPPVCGRTAGRDRAAARRAPAPRWSPATPGAPRRSSRPAPRRRSPATTAAGRATRNSPIGTPPAPGRSPRRRCRPRRAPPTGRNPIVGARSPGRSTPRPA
jgi:hypothetical protein